MLCVEYATVQKLFKAVVVVLQRRVCPQSKALSPLVIQHSQAVNIDYASLYCLITQAALSLVRRDKHKTTALRQSQLLFEFSFGHKAQNAIRFIQPS